MFFWNKKNCQWRWQKKHATESGQRSRGSAWLRLAPSIRKYPMIPKFSIFQEYPESQIHIPFICIYIYIKNMPWTYPIGISHRNLRCGRSSVMVPWVSAPGIPGMPASREPSANARPPVPPGDESAGISPPIPVRSQWGCSNLRMYMLYIYTYHINKVIYMFLYAYVITYVSCSLTFQI